MPRDTEVSDLKKLNNGNLSGDEQDAIGEEVYREIEEEERRARGGKDEPEEEDGSEEEGSEEETPEEKDPESEEVEESEDGGEETEEDKKKKVEEAQAAERIEKIKLGEAALSKEEADRTEEEKEAIKVFEADREESFNKQAEELSKESGIKLEDAKKEIDAYHRITDKYSKDPIKMAKALLSSAREYTRLKGEYEQLKSQPRQEDLLEGEMILNGKVYSAEAAKAMIINAYREKEPEITEGMEDDQVHKIALKKMAEDIKTLKSKQIEELKEKAVSRRADLLRSIPEEAKRFLPDVQTVLDHIPDEAVMNENFNISSTLALAKGKYYDADVKAAEERGYKRGLEKAKIVTEKKPIGNGGSPANKSSGGNSAKWSSLSQEQKEEASDMFSGPEWTDDERAEAYLDYYKEEKSNKKKK